MSVHPRVCGEQRALGNGRFEPSGSSPRVRGTGRSPANKYLCDRFIPACAGNSWSRNTHTRSPPVHPRVCGEQQAEANLVALQNGSSPRVRGTVRSAQTPTTRSRFIPACAGNSRETTRETGSIPVHPRVCGEQLLSPVSRSGGAGSSPRVRGTVATPNQRHAKIRFIPACAGNSFRLLSLQVILSGSSPRVRGTGLLLVISVVQGRFIPACAGNRCVIEQEFTVETVHPRVCGEQSRIAMGKVGFIGSSPRVRGTVVPGSRR